MTLHGRCVPRLPKKVLRIALGAVALVAAIAALFQFVYRPWQMNWGATEDEIFRTMPGDDIVEDPGFNATRAVTIHAPPEQIWPWLVQMGYGKAGFYSWDFLDNANVPSANEILPEYQDLEVGDFVPLSERGYVEVVAMEPNSHLLLVVYPNAQFTWSWGLYPIDAQSTRLVSRLRWAVESSSHRLFLETFEIIMMRKSLLGIQQRAEAMTPAGP
jgi:hypothetical protein